MKLDLTHIIDSHYGGLVDLAISYTGEVMICVAYVFLMMLYFL